jgi:predicted lactoylglutathione lyase
VRHVVTHRGHLRGQRDSRAAVDEMLRRALAAGGSKAKTAFDHGFMYGASFYDVDGHHWECFWMDPSVANAH